MPKKITMEELSSYQQKGAILIDVRDSLEYTKEHLQGSINIPYAVILEKTRNYPKDTIFILYCSTGSRSKVACSLLSSMGFLNVYDLGKVSF